MGKYWGVAFLLTVCGALFSCGEEVEEPYLRVRPTRVHFSNDFSRSFLGVESNVEWTVAVLDSASSWLLLDAPGGSGDVELGVTASENATEENRQGTIVFSAAEGLSASVRITQGQMTVYPDGYVLPVQQSFRGDSIRIVVLGEGFTEEDLEVNGTYEQIMRNAARYFFTIEPYSYYRSFFTVDVLVAESQEEGIGVGSASVRNRFSTYRQSANSTRLVCDHDRVRDFVHYHLPRTDSVTTCVVMVVNDTEYGGSTNVYPDGRFAISMCPMSEQEAPNDLEGLIHHEAGGHGFGLLGDEYSYYADKEIPASGKQTVREAQQNGLWMNLDLTADPQQILWKDFLTDTVKYPYVGAFEGGYYYGKGIWRPEYNSCMNDNIPYYNAPSRWLIVRRIMELSGVEDYTFEDFVAMDWVVPPPVDTVATDISRSLPSRVLPPLASPVIVR